MTVADANLSYGAYLYHLIGQVTPTEQRGDEGTSERKTYLGSIASGGVSSRDLKGAT